MTKRIISDPSLHGWIEENGKWVWNSAGGGGGAGLLISAIEPTGVGEGTMWMDTSTSPAIVWVWDGAAWVEFPFVGSSPKLAAPIPELEYLVIAGGGAGALGTTGGGGAGGYRTNVAGDLSGGNSTAETTPPELLNVPLWTQFIVKVGEGGIGASSINSTNATLKGKNSSFGPVVSTGGGRGDSGNGGSGGGANGVNASGNSKEGGSPQPNQGHKGGGPSQNNTVNGGAGSGGGGAGGEEVANGNTRDGNHGGTGLVSSIDGLNKARGGGGGGGCGSGRSPGDGGNGGGGNGGDSRSTPVRLPTPGEPNTGGGGGSGNSNGSNIDYSLNSGGSGVVIVRYLGPQWATGGVVTSHNGYTVHTFNSGEAIFNVTGPTP